ncbi:hypothetical protein HPB51_015040 [Rhipicephalus microplus]|uniref:Uncharacterized protein n=1 Tax=Rhipicephalus microplus TaxID=6941 RepID=A0A9J6ETA5_RHIMP|nr:hypothetical protein HPB51_015040 [Rhipicephalus microplus]
MEQYSRRYERILDSVVLRRRRRRRRAAQVLQSLRRFTEADGVVALASLKCDAPKLVQLEDFLDELALVLHNYLFSGNEHVVRVALDVVRSAVAKRCHRLKPCNLEHLLASLLRTLVSASSTTVFFMARMTIQDMLRAEPELSSAALSNILEHCEDRQAVEIYMQLIAFVLVSEDILLSVLDRLVAITIRDLMRDSMAHRFCAFEAIYSLHYRYLSRRDLLTYAEQISLPKPVVEALRRRLARRYVPPLKADTLKPEMMGDADFSWIAHGPPPSRTSPQGEEEGAETDARFRRTSAPAPHAFELESRRKRQTL